MPNKVSDAELHRLYKLKCKELNLPSGNDRYRLLGTPRPYSPLGEISGHVSPETTFDDLPDDTIIQMPKWRLIQLYDDIKRECEGGGEML